MIGEFLKYLTDQPSAVRMDRTTRERYVTVRDAIRRVAEREGVPAFFLEAIAWTESNFLATARNKDTNASGLFQIMPMHFRSLGWTGNEWADPTKNAEAGVRILRQHGLGRLPIQQVLKGYGGFVTKDPSVYINRILSRSVYLAARDTAERVAVLLNE